MMNLKPWDVVSFAPQYSPRVTAYDIVKEIDTTRNVIKLRWNKMEYSLLDGHCLDKNNTSPYTYIIPVTDEEKAEDIRKDGREEDLVRKICEDLRIEDDNGCLSMLDEKYLGIIYGALREDMAYIKYIMEHGRI